MKTKFEYLIADSNNIFAVCSTRNESRKSLRSLKAQGHTDAKIYQSEFVHILTKQVR